MVDETETPSPGRARRDRFSLFLVSAGLTGLVGVAFMVHPLLGVAVLSVLVCGGGLLLGMDREQ